MKKKNRLPWYKKYELSLQESLSIQEIMLLRDVCYHTAKKIKEKAIHYCIENDIEMLSSYSIPTEAVLFVTDKDIEYYYQKMILESRIPKVSYVGS